MKSNLHSILLSISFLFLLHALPGAAFGVETVRHLTIEKHQTTKPTNGCGALEFDKKTGGIKRKPNVDLVVWKIEIVRTERGAWVRPWIMNRCPETITADIHVSIGDVVVTISGLKPQVPKAIHSWIAMPPSPSYTVVVDYNNRIVEADESNNSCTKSSTGHCP